MEFLGMPLWYTFVFICIISSFFSIFIRNNGRDKYRRISFLFEFAIWLIFILTFTLTGWTGGAALIVLYFVALFQIGSRFAFILFKRLHPDAKYLTYGLFILRDQQIKKNNRKQSPASEGNKFIEDVKKNKKITNLIKQHGESNKKIESIYATLVNSGVGEFVANCVITNPLLITEFLTMEKKKVKDVDISTYFADALGGKVS